MSSSSRVPFVWSLVTIPASSGVADHLEELRVEEGFAAVDEVGLVDEVRASSTIFRKSSNVMYPLSFLSRSLFGHMTHLRLQKLVGSIQRRSGR